MSKHTPGPWAIRRWSWPSTVTGRIHQVISADNFPTAFVPAWDAPEPGEVEASEEAKANARLIAAAPDLLEALQAIVSIDGHSALSLAEADAIHAKAHAAIKKATGEPE